MSIKAEYEFEKIDEKHFNCKIVYGHSDFKCIIYKYPKLTMSEMIFGIISYIQRNNYDESDESGETGEYDEESFIDEVYTKEEYVITFEEGFVCTFSDTISYCVPFGNICEQLKELLKEYSE